MDCTAKKQLLTSAFKNRFSKIIGKFPERNLWFNLLSSFIPARYKKLHQTCFSRNSQNFPGQLLNEIPPKKFKDHKAL